MFNSPLINSLSFIIGSYQVTCSLEHPSLKITVSPLPDTHPKRSPLLSKMIADHESLSIWVSAKETTENNPFSSKHFESETQNYPGKQLSEKMA